jgi:hypothetical protein
VDGNAQGSPLIVLEDHSIVLRLPAILDTSLKALQLTWRLMRLELEHFG